MSSRVDFEDTSKTMSDMLGDAIAGIQGETIALRELFAILGEQGLLFIRLILSLPFLIPVSIPGISTAFGAAILLLGLSVTMNRLPWLPDTILDRQIESDKLIPLLEQGANYLRRIDKPLRPRLPLLTTGAFVSRMNGSR